MRECQAMIDERCVGVPTRIRYWVKVDPLLHWQLRRASVEACGPSGGLRSERVSWREAMAMLHYL